MVTGSLCQFEDHIRGTAVSILLWPKESSLSGFRQCPQILTQMVDLKHTALILVSREQGQLLCHFDQCLIISLAAGAVDHGEA